MLGVMDGRRKSDAGVRRKESDGGGGVRVKIVRGVAVQQNTVSTVRDGMVCTELHDATWQHRV